MPTYDFQCESCGALFDARVSFADFDQGKLPACPQCGSMAPRRLLSSQVNILTGKPNVTITGMPGSEGGGGCCAGGGCGCQ